VEHVELAQAKTQVRDKWRVKIIEANFHFDEILEKWLVALHIVVATPHC